MEKSSNKQEPDSASALVFQLPGEPAIVINGVPDVNPVRDPFTQLNMPADPDSNDEICFGEWMVGRKVSKMFGDVYYSGNVVNFDSEMKWYRVVYEDGDLEDLDWHELEEVLLPLDISIPLRKLALQTLKQANSDKESGKRAGASRKRGSKNVASFKNPKRRYIRDNITMDRRSANLSKRKRPGKAGSANPKSKLLKRESARSKWKTCADLQVDPRKIIGSHMTNVEIKEVDLRGGLETELQKVLMGHHKMAMHKKSDVGKGMIFSIEDATASKKSGKMEDEFGNISGSHMMNVEVKEVYLYGNVEMGLNGNA